MPKFAVQQAAEPAQVPGEQRPVDPELVVQGLHGALGRERAEGRPAGIAGEDLAGEEYDQAEEEQREDHQA